MNALRVFWQYSTIKDKIVTAFVAIAPALLVLHAVELQSRGVLAKGSWAFGALMLFFIYMGAFALIFGIYRQAKKAKNATDPT